MNTDLLRTDTAHRVPSDGFQLLKCPSGPGSASAEFIGFRCGDVVGKTTYSYTPDRQRVSFTPEMMVGFSHLEPKPSAILDFANRNGTLTRDLDRIEFEGGLWTVEAIDLWRKEIRLFQECFRLFEQIDAERRRIDGRLYERPQAEFRVEFRWGGCWLVLPTREALLTDESKVVAKLQTASQESPLLPALFFLRKEVNRSLEKHTRSALVFTSDPFAQLDPYTASRAGSEDPPINLRDFTALSIVPKDLLGCIWLEFTRLIAGQLRFGRCEKCGTIYWNGRKGAHTRSRRFCSDRCRYAHHAQSKHRKGKSRGDQA